MSAPAASTAAWPALSRRHLLGLLVTTAVSALLARRGTAGPLDQGIGGTGAAPPTDESDRGIGGTGVIGTIRKFGSIIVNDLRIAYPQDAEVRIDGRPASVGDLKIGQVVRVAAIGPEGSLSTRRIDVTSEVVGPVDKTGTKQLTVLGQRVAASGNLARGLKVGETVAVSGLRRNDGTIVASLIERSPGAQSRLAGPLAVGPDGGLRIGGLPVANVDPMLVGRRIVVLGQRDGGQFVATRSTSEATLLPSSVRTLSIESYVERRGDSLRLGSGFAVERATGLDLPEGRSVRAVVRASVGGDGRLIVDSLHTDGDSHGGGGGPGRGGPGRGGSGESPGGRHGTRGGDTRVPMDFGRAPGGAGSPGGPGGPGGGFGGPGGGPGGGFGGPPGGGPGGGFGGPGGGPGGPGGPGGGGPGGGFGGGGRH